MKADICLTLCRHFFSRHLDEENSQRGTNTAEAQVCTVKKVSDIPAEDGKIVNLFYSVD